MHSPFGAHSRTWLCTYTQMHTCESTIKSFVFMTLGKVQQMNIEGPTMETFPSVHSII